MYAGSKRNFREVLDAIRMLHKLESEARRPTEDERGALRRFTGFGPIANVAFPNQHSGEYKEGFEELAKELESLLSEKEYTSARRTTPTAFYTAPLIMESIYAALNEMGLERGDRGLEPGCGIGNFMGAAPEGLEFIGIERDTISGRIAKLLYPDHNIRIEDIKDTLLADGSVDFVVGNVPFSSNPIRYRGHEHYPLHDCCFLKGMDALRPGGILALVTSRWLMDKKDPTVRRKLAAKGELVGAIRLPEGAFRRQGTEVITDLVFLRKTPEKVVLSDKERRRLERRGIDPDEVSREPRQVPRQDWIHTVTVDVEGGELTLNEYFAHHPQKVLGELSCGRGMYNDHSMKLEARPDYEASLRAAIRSLPHSIMTERPRPLAEVLTYELDPNLPEGLTEGSLFLGEDGRTILQVENGAATELTRGASGTLVTTASLAGRRLAGLIDLKDKAREVLKAQTEGAEPGERDRTRRVLQHSYERFTRRFGPINKTSVSVRKDGAVVRRLTNIGPFAQDPDVYLVQALEDYDEPLNEARPTAIMTRDVVAPPREITRVSSAKEGLVASLNNVGSVDIDYIAQLYGEPVETVTRELQADKLVYFDPDLARYVTADEFLSGDVRAKLATAEAATDPRTKGNAEALRAVQPDDIPAEDIDVGLGTPWIPESDLERFIAETFAIPAGEVKVHHVPSEASWKVVASSSLRRMPRARADFGTEDRDGFELIQNALNLRVPTVRVKVHDPLTGEEKWQVDEAATLAARTKQDELRLRFSEWIFTDPDRRHRLVRHYNDQFNNIRLRQFDGSHLTFPGMSKGIALYDHQKAAIWRNISAGNTGLFHKVGFGKTFTMIATAMEMKRQGLVSKPLLAVPNHMLVQFAREFRLLYPNAHFLVATKNDLTKQKRQLFKARVATGDWDAVIMTHSSFEKISMSPEFQDRFIQEQLEDYESKLDGAEGEYAVAELERAIETLNERRANLKKQMAGKEMLDLEARIAECDHQIEVAGSERDRLRFKNERRGLVKKREALRERFEGKIQDAIDRARKDSGLVLEQLGIDWLFVDEAHLFKNLQISTKMDRVAGIPQGGSKRAFDLFMKVRYLSERTPGRGVTFATGTPVANTMAEMYVMMRYLMPEELAKRGIEHFDAWAAAFGEIVSALEISPDGQNLRNNTRFAKFKNLPELLTIFRICADVQNDPAQVNLAVPSLKGGAPRVVSAEMSDVGHEIQMTLLERYDAVRNGKVDPWEDNVLKIITEGRKLAIDPRLASEHGQDDPGSKVNQLCDEVYRIWTESAAGKGTQMVFSDLGVSTTPWGFNLYDDIVDNLVERGIPPEEIAKIGDANTDQKKETLFSQMRAGTKRVLIGSTAKMGTGTNVQNRLVALHHVDPTWRPCDIEQREGRILRQGNLNPEVEVLRYVTEGSFDSYMWQTLETKAKFIEQAMRGDAGARRADDIGEDVLSYAAVKAIATGNPAMIKLAEMEAQARQLTLRRTAHGREQGRILAKIQDLPHLIADEEKRIAALEADLAERVVDTAGDAFRMVVEGKTFVKTPGEEKSARQRAEAALAVAVATAHVQNHGFKWEQKVGEIGGFSILAKGKRSNSASPVRFDDTWLELEGDRAYEVRNSRMGDPKSPPALVSKLEAAIRSVGSQLDQARARKAAFEEELVGYQGLQDRAFPMEAEYRKLIPMKNRLQLLLSGDTDKDGALEEIAALVQAFDAMDLSNSSRPSRPAAGPAPTATEPGESDPHEPVVEPPSPEDLSLASPTRPVEPADALFTGAEAETSELDPQPPETLDPAPLAGQPTPLNAETGGTTVPVESNDRSATPARWTHAHQRQMGLFSTGVEGPKPEDGKKKPGNAASGPAMSSASLRRTRPRPTSAARSEPQPPPQAVHVTGGPPVQMGLFDEPPATKPATGVAVSMP